jgi:hypothetical protein
MEPLAQAAPQGTPAAEDDQAPAALPVVEITPTAEPSGEDQPTPLTDDRPTLPQGWEEVQDLGAGTTYLAPSLEDERAIRQGFEAALACKVMADGDDAEALEFDKLAVLDGIAQSSTADVVAECEGETVAWLVTLGPENPVRCESAHLCRLGRMQTATHGYVAYVEGYCEDETPCVVRDYEDPSPYRLYTATIERQEDGSWLLTAFETAVLPSPPTGGGS